MRIIRLFISLVVFSAIIVAVYFLLLHYWYRPTYIFVYTDNARIDGAIIKVVAESRGQLIQSPYETGQLVKKDQIIATLKGMSAAGVPSDIGSQKYFYQYILSPVSGRIVNRAVNPGDMVFPGQPLMTISDFSNLWIIANIDENDISRVRPGQRVNIHVDTTNEILIGKVEHIVPSTTSIVQRGTDPSLIVAANTQDVPVKISFEQNGQYQLYPGLSVEITIFTR